MKTGYIESYNENKSRKQVIIVVRDDLTVLCYDETLQLLWEKAVAHKAYDIEGMVDKFKVDQIAVLVSPLSIKAGTVGVVVVGVSMKLKPEYENSFKVEDGIDMTEIGAKEHPEMEMRSKLEHFSVFALDAHNGHVLWKHDGLEVRAEQFTMSLPQHAYKLESRDLSRQLHGSSDWTVFRQSLINELPHDWHSKDDTSLRFAQFTRRHLGATSGSQVKKEKIKNVENSQHNTERGAGHVFKGDGKFSGVEEPPLSLSAVLPHDASEHTEYPNVIVSHTKRGLEVISLKTGLPITSLALNEGQSYADLNGDGIVDSLLVLEDSSDVATHGESFAHDGGQLQPCMVLAVSGLPARTQLFNGSLCFNHRNLHDPLSQRKKQPPLITAASPLILKAIDPNTMREAKVRDVVISINTGSTACYSGDGEYRWFLKGTPSWDLDSASHSVVAFDSDSIRVDELGTHDNRHAQILILGDTAVALVSRDGFIETHAEVPGRAVTRPTIGDFDSDYINDVIIVTEDALLGYRLEITASAKGMLIAFVILALVAVVVFISTLRSEIVVSDAKTSATSRRIFSSMRSTEEYHID